MSKRRFILHVVSHTRWDREWYRTFQNLRVEQVHLMDVLLDTLTTQSRFASFTLDGQTILLDDYLEVRPGERDRIARLVQGGRLEIGPWYILTDEFLVSAEALVRNLELGAQTAAQYGARMNVGYTPNSSGHVGQMPQILCNFGITSAVIMRGLGNAPAELWWEAPDGSRVLVSHLRDGYSNAMPLPTAEDELKAVLVQARDSLKRHSATDTLLLMNGGDQKPAQAETPDLIGAIKKRFRGTQVIHSSLTAYLDEVLASSDHDLPIVVGELRSPQRFYLMSGVLSTRMWLKQRNHAIQTLLEHWAEPFSAWATRFDSQYSPEDASLINGKRSRLRSPAALNRLAWRTLLQNHHHESIAGCSIDQVTNEIRARFDQAEQIAQEIAQQNLDYLASQVNTASLPGDDSLLPIIVFNSAGQAYSDLVTVEVPGQPDLLWPFEVIDEVGNSLPFDIIRGIPQDENESAVPTTLQIQFVAQDVPACGYRTYALRPAKAAPEYPEIDDGLTVENEYLSVTISTDDGTLTLFDKRSGRSFSGLNRYVDGGDRGDAYNYCPPTRDTIIDIATNTPLHVERQVGVSAQSLSFLQIYRLPNELTPERNARLPLAAQFAPMSIVTTLRIASGIPRVDIEVDVTNGARDHRLRVHFPTGIITQEAFYDGHFEVVSRPVALPATDDTLAWVEQPVTEVPQRAFVSVLGDETGLTIANRGLPEVAVIADGDTTEIALTLLRCVGWLSRDDLSNRIGSPGPEIEIPNAQCLGEHTFEYSVIPHGADPLPAWQEAWGYQSPLAAMLTDVGTGQLPLHNSLVTLDNPAFILSAVKTSADGEGLIVRGYNIGEEMETVTLALGVPFAHADRVQMDEGPDDLPLSIDKNGHVQFEARPSEIVTIYFANPT